MLTEEAHHMFVGISGISRVIQKTCSAMKAAGIEDPNEIEKIRSLGVIDLPTIQKKANFHYSVSLDLFGSELSTNAANFFNSGIKGRYQENDIDDDHRLTDATYPVMRLINGVITQTQEAALPALNMRLRDDYVRDCARGVERWNQLIAKEGIEFSVELPHVAFNRHVGEFSSINATPQGMIINEAKWQKNIQEYLPSVEDKAYIASLMRSVTAPGSYASWISPPARMIDNKPEDFEFVRIQH
jgi:benzoyl-CoA 2,3-dioxygenase component B